MADPKKYDKIITDPDAIQKHLYNGYMSDQRFEIRISQRVRLHFTQMMDHLPERTVKRDDEGQPVLKDGEPVLLTPHYRDLSYLAWREHLLFSPLTPAKGNLYFKKYPDLKVRLRFFHQVYRVESVIRFKKIIKVRGEPALMFTYPTKMGLMQAREHFRFRIPRQAQATLTVKGEGIEEQSVPLFDLSAGGLAFCHPIPIKSIPQDTQLVFTLTRKGGESVTIPGWVRNHSPVSKAIARKRLCRISHAITGVQFDMQDNADAAAINGYVFAIQRLVIAIKKRRDEASESLAEEAEALQLAEEAENTPQEVPEEQTDHSQEESDSGRSDDQEMATPGDVESESVSDEIVANEDDDPDDETNEEEDDNTLLGDNTFLGDGLIIDGTEQQTSEADAHGGLDDVLSDFDWDEHQESAEGGVGDFASEDDGQVNDMLLPEGEVTPAPPPSEDIETDDDVADVTAKLDTLKAEDAVPELVLPSEEAGHKTPPVKRKSGLFGGKSRTSISKQSGTPSDREKTGRAKKPQSSGSEGLFGKLGSLFEGDKKKPAVTAKKRRTTTSKTVQKSKPVEKKPVAKPTPDNAKKPAPKRAKRKPAPKASGGLFSGLFGGSKKSAPARGKAQGGRKPAAKKLEVGSEEWLQQASVAELDQFVKLMKAQAGKQGGLGAMNVTLLERRVAQLKANKR
ncbi:MAG: PilZ domain-containing protein [Magnetococcales bacterium]|nr:PilZ domain-containing protein [Magnetococcales bacterium]